MLPKIEGTFAKGSYVEVLQDLCMYLPFKMCPLLPKYPRFLVEISENVPVFLKNTMGNLP